MASETATGRAGMSARYLETIERLLELPSADLKTTLTHASDLVARATGADKVDAFLYDPSRDSLVAVTSNQPLSALQRKLGLDVLPVSNGGRVVHVYTTGDTFVTGRLDEDQEELRGVKEGLGIRSKIGVPLTVAGSRRGTMMLASQTPDYFTGDDVRFAEAVGRWTAAVAHRAELVEDITRNAAEHGRRAGAEELVTVLAHDMRNLVAPVDVLLQSLHRRATNDGRAQDVTDLDMARRALGRLRGLMGDILDVARIESGLFGGTLEPIDLPALVAETAKTLGVAAHPVHVHIAVTGKLVVAADAGRLRQCFENLIINAIEKSPKDAPVDVLVSSHAREDSEWAVVEVIDQGPGVPPDMVSHIFDRFVTAKHGGGGLGLGLYLAKQIAVMHGGELSVDTEPRQGARFIVALPCSVE
jgi:two-component system, OmpR family, sensor kinase